VLRGICRPLLLLLLSLFLVHRLRTRHKPSHHLVQPAVTDLSVAGPIASTAEDLALALQVLAASDVVLAGPSATDVSTAAAAEEGRALGSCRIAVWTSADGTDGGAGVAGGVGEGTRGRFQLSAAVQDTVEAAACALEGAGAVVERNARPTHHSGLEAHETYLKLASALYAGQMDDLEFQQLSKTIARVRSTLSFLFQILMYFRGCVAPTSAS
jgi:Asp-tRNA(Asn)/Glu-tRNA(Gln) amidotransferase A subunit family amidase